MDGAVDLGACQSQRILIDEDAVRNRVSMWVGGGWWLSESCTREDAVLGPPASPSGPSPSFPLLPSSLSQINVFDLPVL